VEAGSLETPGPLIAQGCSPGMSCFGHVVVLPNGEVAEAAVEAAAAAAATTMQSEKAKPAKAEVKSAEKTDTKTRLKRKVTCENKGGNVKQNKKKIRCTYFCPGEPPGVDHVVELDIPECPRFWDFWL
jgi:tetraacyldisaccharide-1-P 4'-kinase